MESAELREATDRYEYSVNAGALTIPLTLRDSLMARLDRFAPAKEIAQVGATIGREFSYELISAVASRNRPALDHALGQLTASGLAFCRGTPPNAVYTFKHALVRDAAYDSLLKSRRQELHGKIARAIEDQLPTAQSTEPELLAQHYTEARQLEKAIPLWQKAGSLALKRMALTEAISHLEKGLNLITALPPSVERDGWELDLRTALGTSWLALKGWQSQEVWAGLHPALALANLLRRCDALVPILWGLFIHVLTRGRVRESLGWAKQMLEAAATYRDPDLLILGHNATATAYLWLGELVQTRKHADEVLSLYTEEQHGHLCDILSQDPKTGSLILKAHSTWMLGYPDQAIQISDVKDAYARQLEHPFDLGWALTTGAQLFDHLREPEEELKRVQEAERLGHEHSIPFLWLCLAPVHAGVSLIRQGKIAQGMTLLKSGRPCENST